MLVPTLSARSRFRAGLTFALCPLLIGLAACSMESSDETADDSDVGSTSDAISAPCAMTRSQILASVSGGRRRAIQRGFSWLDENVPYSQQRSHEGYRTDCSGFVSMCWELGRSYTTADFIAGGGQSGPLPSYDELLPGDALVRRSNGTGHVVLFLGWNDARQTSACVLEQASTAADMQFRSRTTSSLRSSGYRAIRADKF